VQLDRCKMCCDVQFSVRGQRPWTLQLSD